MKIAWVITGAGHFLKECFEIVGELNGRAVLFFSKAGLEVTKMYGLNDFLAKRNIHVINDEKASSPSCGAFAARRYEVLVIAPATSNTIAKCALGIADSLPTNLFAQAGKSQIPILVLPSDTAPKIDSVIPSLLPQRLFWKPQMPHRNPTCALSRYLVFLPKLLNMYAK
jgi:dihydromethanopterin reductase (acceptor)